MTDHETSDEVLQAWLKEALGLDEYRRVVRESDTTVVISKFPPGFTQELFATMDALPDLLEDATVAAEYDRIAAEHAARGEASLRTQVWRDASEALLERLGRERGLSAESLHHVLPGIESVQAVLDTILWSAPTITDDYKPAAGEIEAYEEFVADESGRIFTRFYGDLAGRSVENYCPGSQFARRLVAQAWRICTRNA
jgi:hypothetical protein